MSSSMEPEMSYQQRLVVDLCFEESEYEAAIDMLVQLTSPRHRPTKLHIRQLLYIALFSPTDRHARIDPLASPSKRERKLGELPSAAASLAARNLLMAFAETNTPAAVLLALRPGDVDSPEEAESSLATESLCISRAKNCWQILAKGFLLNQQQQQFASVKGKGKVLSAGSFGDLHDTASPVGETAWPILEWLISIFERDEVATNATLRHSPLLLEQLGTASRRDSDAALAICHYSFAQSDPRRRALGIRLLNLLINLSSATDLDFPLIVVSIFNGLSESTSAEDIASLLAGLHPSSAVSKFKIALYQKYFNDTASNTTTNRKPIAARPRPQARAAQPKGSPAKARQSTSTSSASPSSLANKYRAPTSGDILRLLMETQASPRNKYDLLVAYNEYQALAPASERDPEWLEVARNGTVLDKAFGCKAQGAATMDPSEGEGVVYRDLLAGTLSVY
ncbi:hypothetical protein HMN09_00764900 [Mycena chlorophos]|uniref:Uncharacterized protein n=1 Tax=Mycena chlorophos TaxID=658473 RepID=A0A8H6SVL3_MYCCL|nr:hypothetical protein HMN09_00764900 [Mycena chlorophos]